MSDALPTGAPRGYATIWQLAGPNIASNILLVLISFAHVAIVAPLGAEASAAVVAGARLQFIMFSAVMALGVATTALVARAWGGDDAHEAANATTASMTLALAITAALGVVFFAGATGFVGLFNLDPQSTAMAVIYTRVAALTFVAYALFMTFTAAQRAIGDVVRPLYATAVASGLSIFLSYTMVHGSFGLVAQGPAGVVWGTAIGQGTVAIYLVASWALGRYRLKLVPNAFFRPGLLAELIRIGLPAALEQVLIQGSFIAFMVLISGAGTAAFAAYGIGITVLTVCIVIGLGFGTASATLTGQAIGSGKLDDIRQHGWKAMRLAVVCMSLVALITLVCREPLADLLTNGEEVKHHTLFFIWVLAAIQPLMAIEFALGGALRGAGDTRFPLLVTICGNIIARLSLGLLVVEAGLHVHWLYSVIILDYSVKALLLVLRFRGKTWVQVAVGHPPSALPSLAGLSRAAVRAFYTTLSSRKP